MFNRGIVCFALAGLRIMDLACSLAKLASLIRTMLGLLDLRRMRLARSLVLTILSLLGLRRRRLARTLVELAKSRFCVNFGKIVRNTTRRFTFNMIFRKSSYLRGF